LTLFPEMVTAGLSWSVTGRAIEAGLMHVGVHDIREFSTNKHRNVDDSPYGGGPGMVMSAEPLVAAIEQVAAKKTVVRTIMMSPSGRVFDQGLARELADLDGSVMLICGRYEGVDARVPDHFCDEELSIGDYVITGGELAAMVVIDAVTRLEPGALGNAESPVVESMSDGALEYPQYTRPRAFRGHEVPPILLGGNHADIARWRRQQSLRRTQDRRPDLFERLELGPNDKKLLES